MSADRDEEDMSAPTPDPPQTEELNVHDDYFPSPHPPPLPPRPGEKLRPQTATTPHAKATIAISLPEGVYAQQQDGVSSTSGGSVTTALSFSDSHSVRSLAPTLNTGENDVESMLGEILEETESTYEVEVLDSDSEEEDMEDSSSDDGASEEERLARWRARRKHFFILSAAGKPIYSRHGNEAIISSYIGVIQAIISFFADSDDQLQSFTSGSHRFAVLAAGPLYLVAISSLGETAPQLRSQLDSLYAQVLSTLSLPQLTQAFAHRYNFDLRRLLGGTEVFLDGLVDSMIRGSPAILLSALECIKLRKTHRAAVNNILIRHRAPSLLYGLLVAGGRLISVIRPKRHSLHPPDLMLLFSMLFNATTFSDGSEHWIPICLPRFNPKGFLHAYIHFFRPDLCMVLISADKDAFFEMRAMREAAESALVAAKLLTVMQKAVPRYSVQDVIPGELRVVHFLYKSRQNVQFTMPEFSACVDQGKGGRRRLMRLYHRLHASVHAKGAHLKGCWVSRGGEEALAWVLPGCEVYVVARGGGRERLAKAAQRVVRWVREEEERLFVIGGATF